jgi:hypothetical protein
MNTLKCLKKKEERYFSNADVYSIDFLSELFSAEIKMNDFISSLDNEGDSNSKDISIFVKIALTNFTWESVDCTRELIEYILNFDIYDLMKLRVSGDISEFDSLLASMINSIQKGSLGVIHLLPIERCDSNIEGIFNIFCKVYGLKSVIEYFKIINRHDNEYGVSPERRSKLTKHFCSWLNTLNNEYKELAINEMK